MQNIIGIDIGGSHITLAQVDPKNRKVISSTYVRDTVDSLDKQDKILSAWVSAIEKAAKKLNFNNLLIGIAMPGPFDYENGISLMLQGKFIDIYKVNIKEELAKRLCISTQQIHFLNDALAFLEGEVYGGCVGGFQKIFGVTLGTGLGTTFFNSTFATDENLWNKPMKDSISEDYLATRWFVKRYADLTGKTISGSKDLQLKSKEIQSRIFEEFADSFAEFIAKYVKPYNPEVLVIGGNITKAYPHFEKRFNENLIKNNIFLQVKISEIFEDAAILGAASYALKKVKDQ